MDRINRAVQGTSDIEQVLTDFLEAVLDVLACDRAWLVYPCDPEAESWRAVMERTRPEYPGAFVLGQTFPMTENIQGTLHALLGSMVPLVFGTGVRPLPEIDEKYQIRSMMARAVRPKLDKPYAFGVHQCTHAREWTADEERLFEGIARRLEDALSNLLMFRRLRASEARQSMAQRVAHVGHWEENLVTGECSWSDETYRIFGVEPGAIDPSPAAAERLLHPADRARFAEEMSGVRRRSHPSPFAFEYRVGGGRAGEEPRVVRLEGHVLADTQGQPSSVFGIAQDITKRRRAEQELRASERRFRAFVDHATDGLFIHARDGVIVDVNRQACESLGYTRDELVGMNPMTLDAEMAPELMSHFSQRLDQGEVLTFETRHRRKDGATVPVEVRTRPYWEDGQRFAISLVRDVSERRRALEALQASHGLLRAVVDGTSDSVFVKDLEGRYLTVNAAGAELLGRPAVELIGKTDAELQTPSHDVIRSREMRVISTGGSQTFEHTTTWSGAPRTYLSTTSPYRDGRGTVLGVVWISRDVTEFKRLEEQFRQSQKMEAVGRLAGGIAHDFNNLLTVINGYCELVFSSMNTDDPNRELIAEVQKAGERAGKLTRQLLAFSRKQMLQPRAVNVNALVDDLHHLLRRLISEDVELELRLAPDLGMARVDPGQFEQAIVNLAVNARDAMPEGGRLTINTSNAELVGAGEDTIDGPRDGAYICVSLTDVGHGMDESVRGRIFEPFFTTKEQGKGTGLGLAMVYGFVIQSGGHIEVESEPGAGSTFRLYLPRDEAGATPARGIPEAEPQIRGTETLLLVEDDESVRSLSRLILQSYGYTVLEASNGEDGLRVAQGHAGPIQLLVTDLVMPRMSGRRLADVLGAARPGLKVLLLSGYTDETVIRHDVVRSGFAFLHKPFTAMALARRVREVLDRR
jgi:PAS domain S-box-containing protein